MNFSYDMKDVVDFTLSFSYESSETQWYLDGIKKGKDFINEELKNKLPKKKIFKINSLMYNIENQSKDLIISLDCSYNDVNNSLSIIVNENIDHNNLTKEVALTLFHFVQKVNIEKLYLIVALKNPNYILLLQEMMTLGFQSEKSVRSINIDGDAYKILYVETKEMSKNIEELDYKI